MNCQKCKFYFHEGNYGLCKRYPENVVKGGADFCGEHKEKFVHPTEEVNKEVKKGKKNVSKAES